MRIIISLCFLLLSTLTFATAPKLEPVKLQLKWFHAFQFAGYYAAKEQGYYANEGLDVQFIEPIPEKPIISEVLSGSAHYGIESSGILVQYANGSPIKALAAIFQHSPLVFISKQSSGIIGPDGMRGKRLMMYGNKENTDEVPLKAMLFDAEVSSRQYTLIPHTFNIDDLILDKVDVVTAYLINEPYYFRNKDIAINIIKPQNYGFDFYDDLLFTSQTEIDNHPERVKRFRRASLKGWQYALDHPEELVQLIHKQYNSQYSIEHLRYQAEKTSKLIVADNIPLGEIKASRLRHIITLYHRLNLAKNLTDTELNSFIYQNQIDLTVEEQQWLDQHPVIRLGINNDFAPHEWIDEQGNYTGHSTEYIKLLEQRLNIKFDIIKDKSWPEILAMVRQGSLDMLADIVDTKDRRKYLNFSHAYIKSPVIIINDNSYGYIGTLKNLHHKTVAIEKSYVTNEFLQQNHPEINILPVDSTNAALYKVSKGEADAYVGGAEIANYAISKTGLLNLRFSGQTEFINRHSIGVSKSHPLLLSIINKALASISQAERSTINNRWLGLHIETGIKTETLVKYGIAILALFLLFTFWIIFLRQEIRKRHLTELNLRKSEHRFVKSQHFAHFGIWDWNIEKNTLYWSETLFPLLGYSKNKVTPTYDLFINTVHIEDRQPVIDAIQACIDNHQPYDLEHRIVWPDGSVHWIHTVGNAIYNKEGVAIQMLGTIKDMTERKRVDDILQTLAESKSLKQENIFRVIVRKLALSQDVAYALIGQINIQNPHIVDTLAVWGNAEYVNDFSYALEGTPCENVSINGYCLYPDNVQTLFPEDHMLVDMGIKSYLGVPLKDSEQNVIGILALLDHKPMEKHLKTENLLKSLAVRAAIEIERSKSSESLQIAALVYQNTHEAMLMTDANNNIIAINPAFTKITGYSQKDVLGQYARTFQLKQQTADTYTTIWQSIQQTGQWQGEVINNRKNGEEYIEYLKISSILNDKGKVYRRIALFSDITEIKKAETLLKQNRDDLLQEVDRQTHALKLAKNEAEQANHAKSAFLANMSHELRTPMHGILSFARLGIKNIEKGNLESLAKYFDRINISGERLLTLLNDLLDLSKLEAGKMEINKKSCNLYQLVNQCLAEQESWLKDKQLTLIWQEVCDKPQADLDSAKIIQVITNLLTNAIKFSKQGKRLFLSINTTKLSSQPALTFSLRDEGLGIPEQELESVFDKFIQSSKTSTGGGGTGLGLAICMEIINAHQGKIWAENTPQGGAVFFMEIPVKGD